MSKTRRGFLAALALLPGLGLLRKRPPANRRFKFQVGQYVKVRVARVVSGPGSKQAAPASSGYSSTWKKFGPDTIRVDCGWFTGRINKQSEALVCEGQDCYEVLVQEHVFTFALVNFAEESVRATVVDRKTKGLFPV